MTNEKQNEPISWKDKLEALDSLPGELMPDKNAVWEKLQHRLYKKPVHNRAVWYWAAACLLTGIIIAGLIIVQKDSSPVKDISIGKSNKTKIVPPVPSIEKKEMAAVIPPVETAIANNSENKSPSIHFNKIMKKARPVNTIIIPLAEINVHAPAPNPLIAIAGPAPKKQIPVVHINELETGPQQIATSQRRRKNYFSIQRRDDRDIPAAAVSEKEYAGLSTIKIPLKN